jgi:putative membrane protein
MNWSNTYKGIAMGMVETVPGVSSSTVAMLLGIYESIIAAISDLTSKRYKKAILFLIPVGVGILIGVALSALVVKYFLETFPVPTHYLFIGLIVGMLPLIWRNGIAHLRPSGTYQGKHYLLMVLFFLLIASFDFINPTGESIVESMTVQDAVYLFIAGWLASIALVLPGMSGALILMIVGAYHTALEALLTFNIPMITVIVAGLVIGMLLTGKLVRHLLKNYYQSTYAAILGMLTGSIIIIYPGIPQGVMEFLASGIVLVLGFVVAFKLSNR